jgi:opacity protein-like surface antigen
MSPVGRPPLSAIGKIELPTICARAVLLVSDSGRGMDHGSWRAPENGVLSMPIPRQARSMCRQLALAACLVAGCTTGTLAQSQGPTLVQWLRGPSPPAAAAPQGAPPQAAERQVAPPPAPAAATPAPPARDGRIYVRSDFSVGLRSTLDQTNGDCSSSSIIELCGFSASGNAGAAYGGTLGLGYRMTDWLRTDATFTYRGGEQAAGNIDRFNGQPATAALGARFAAATVMVNLYVDVAPALGFERGWFQPYIGAGVGPSFNHADSTALIGNLPGGFTGVTLSSHTTSDIAWNAGGGFAFRLFDGFAADIGYRYVDLGGFRTGSGSASPSGAAVDPLRYRVRLHEIYIGFRVMFD